MPQARIVVTGSLPEWALKSLQEELKVVCFDDADEQSYRCFDAGGVVAIISRGSLPVDREIIERAPDLRVIAKTGVGMDAIDVEAATRRRIPVLFTPGALSRSVSEHTLMMILSLLKRLAGWQSELRAGSWNSRYEQLSRDLTGRRVGIVGYGRIGSDLRRLLRPFDCAVAVCDPYLDPAAYKRHRVEFMDLEGLLGRSDIVSLHVPLTDETRGMIHDSNLNRLTEDAILVNTARGAVIDSLDSLHEGLQSGALGGVGVDVFAVEPPDIGHPLFRHPRAILTGHVASRSDATQRRIVDTTLRELGRVLAGRRPNAENVVNGEVL